MMLSIVGRSSFLSWRLAPSIVRPMGTPCPSVSRLRFTPLLPRSVGLGPVFSPPKGAAGSWPRPSRASSSQSRTAHQTAPPLLARVREKHWLSPTLESDHARWNAYTARSDPGPAIGSPFAAHKRWHQHKLDRTRVDVPHQNDAY